MRLILLAFLFINGCATLGPNAPGTVKIYESKTEGSRNLELIPGWIYATEMKVGLFKTNSMKPDEVILIVGTRGGTIEPKEGLIIKVDETKHVLSSIDDISDLSSGFFFKRYVVPVSLIKNMNDGKAVYIRANLRGQSYIEGEFSKGGYTTAKDGFTEFLKVMNNMQVSQK